MVDVATLQWAVAAVYGVSGLAMAGASLRVQPNLQRYCGLFTAVVLLNSLNLVFRRLELGIIATTQGELFIITVLTQVIAYTVLYGAVMRLGGASRLLTAGVIGISLLPTMLIQVGAVIETGQWFVVVSLASFVLPFPILAYLFLRPIWRTALNQPPTRRLLHWKARNLILFVYVMLLVYIGLVISGLVSDPVVDTILFQYVSIVFNLGLPGFLIYKSLTLDDQLAEELTTTG